MLRPSEKESGMSSSEHTSLLLYTHISSLFKCLLKNSPSLWNPVLFRKDHFLRAVVWKRVAARLSVPASRGAARNVLVHRQDSGAANSTCLYTVNFSSATYDKVNIEPSEERIYHKSYLKCHISSPITKIRQMMACFDGVQVFALLWCCAA